MLLGYNPKTGSIEFLFSDTNYLKKMYPNGNAHITNFWKNSNHGLIEMTIDPQEFPDYRNYQLYKVVDGKIVLKTKEDTEKEINLQKKSKIILDESKTNISTLIQKNNDNFLSVSKIRINDLEKEIEVLKNKIKEIGELGEIKY